jgi:hypothetical protein
MDTAPRCAARLAFSGFPKPRTFRPINVTFARNEIRKIRKIS